MTIEYLVKARNVRRLALVRIGETLMYGVVVVKLNEHSFRVRVASAAIARRLTSGRHTGRLCR